MGYLTRSDFLRLSGLATAGICAQALLSSCSPGTTTPAATTAAEAPGTDGVKMGVSIWSSTDPLGALSVDIIRQAANALGAEVVVVDHAYVPERVTASVETLAAAGCDGIVVCNATDAEMASIIRSCDDNDVYVTQFYRHIREDGQEAGSTGVRALAEASRRYVGAVHGDEAACGVALMQALLEKGGPSGGGARHVGLVGWVEGDVAFQQRLGGLQQALDEWNAAHPDDTATLFDPIYAGLTAGGGARAVESLANAHLDMDALVVAGGGGDPLVGALGWLERAGRVGQVSVVACDFPDDLADRLASGEVLMAAGGDLCDPLFALVLTYQAVTGKLIVSEGDLGRELVVPHVHVSDAEGYAAFEASSLDRPPCSDDEVRGLADLSFEGLRERAEDLVQDRAVAGDN